MIAEAEISYDLVMVDNMSFVEGCYRLPGLPWKVFVTTRGYVTEPAYRCFKWDSGVSGLVLDFPAGAPLNKTLVERLLSSALGVEAWREVRGPDSIVLR
jgi:hypothetical protein